ncbi:MAG TPA: SEL1-like repeat protein, partial [Burkholderiaceae bacterium]|nr:SEL1-like repeat protein [Burkholderiaceae bacterium]
MPITLVQKYYLLFHAHCDARAMIERARIVPAEDQGNPASVDFNKTFADALNAAAGHDAVAHYRLGLMYKKEIGTTTDQKLAKENFEKAAELGNVDAQLEMGIHYDR